MSFSISAKYQMLLIYINIIRGWFTNKQRNEQQNKVKTFSLWVSEENIELESTQDWVNLVEFYDSGIINLVSVLTDCFFFF